MLLSLRYSSGQRKKDFDPGEKYAREKLPDRLRPSLHLLKDFVQRVLLQGMVQDPGLGNQSSSRSSPCPKIEGGFSPEAPFSRPFTGFAGVGFSWLLVPIWRYLHVI